LTSVNVQSRAEADADDAAAWYETEQPGLGIEFLLELDAAIERAAGTPLAYTPVFLDARRVLMRRFPFAVYFVYEHDVVEVFAVLHQRRAGALWKSRARD
jgi:plasmid stabilization system protein ParE